MSFTHCCNAPQCLCATLAVAGLAEIYFLNLYIICVINGNLFFEVRYLKCQFSSKVHKMTTTLFLLQHFSRDL